jgi:hypothetical protein
MFSQMSVPQENGTESQIDLENHPERKKETEAAHVSLLVTKSLNTCSADFFLHPSRDAITAN